MDSLHRYLDLDHGFCGVVGDTDPVVLDRFGAAATLEVPRKCSTCEHLKPHKVYDLVCTKDSHLWGDFSRSLDWGVRAPSIRVPGARGLQITLRFVRLAAAGDDVGALREFRASNPDAPLASGKALCAEVRVAMRRQENS